MVIVQLRIGKYLERAYNSNKRVTKPVAHWLIAKGEPYEHFKTDNIQYL